MKKITIGRKEVQKQHIIDARFIQLNQRDCINQLFLDEEFEGKKEIKRELKKKLSSYKAQDIKKKRFEDKLFISLFDLIERLVISKLKCIYCKSDVVLIYNCVRYPKQWTLDRVNNDMGHNTDNVVIACLECNLKRRRINDKKFLFTKQMKIIKKY